MAAKDYTGKICGCWKVLKRDWEPVSKSHETFWYAECQNCGNITSVRKTDLDKNPQACNKCKGDNISKILRERNSSYWQIGDKYGLLTIIGKSSRQLKHTYVKVQCDCGSEPFEVRLEHLKGQGQRGRTISCGCIKASAGELKIQQLLEQTNINFQKQYRVIDELDNHAMFFDFVLLDENNKIYKVIEFNGKQHYEPIEYFGGEKTFQRQQERDKRKRAYCQRHDIFLQEIPYTDFDSINLEMLVSTSK